eukprot:GFUD01031543.1.p1 GENE.GFUD01031543.1~~GFUD01031543.1.p1  ORF type:complete len:144 (-),score=22.51 GFUD01031543.1:21-452(-)
MTISTYCGVPEDILDGIFSDEEVSHWKEISESKNMKKRESESCKSCHKQMIKQSHIIEIEPSDCCKKKSSMISKTKPLQWINLKINLRKLFLLYLTECSYIPFLFMFIMTTLSLCLTGLPCLLVSLAVCVSVAAIHLSYIAFI